MVVIPPQGPGWATVPKWTVEGLLRPECTADEIHRSNACRARTSKIFVRDGLQCERNARPLSSEFHVHVSLPWKTSAAIANVIGISEVGTIEGPYADRKGRERLVLNAYHPIIRDSERLELAGDSNHLEGILLAGLMQGGPASLTHS